MQIRDILFGIAIILLTGYCYTQHKIINSMEIEYQNKNCEFSILKEDWNKKDTTVKIQSEQLANKKSEIYSYAKKNSTLNSINSQLRAKLQTKIDTIFIPFISDSILVNSNAHSDSISVPKSFYIEHEEGFYEVGGKVLKNGIKIDSLIVSGGVQVTIGNKKSKGLKSLFKNPENFVEVVAQSPYMNITCVSNVNFERKKSSRFKNFISGGAIGFIFAAILFL